MKILIDRYNKDILLYFARADGFEEEIMIENFDLAPGDPNSEKGGETVQGVFRARALTPQITGNSPIMKLVLELDSNTAVNQEIFKYGKITDILLVFPCLGDLRNFPL